jgi:hypothetical protein
VIAHSLALIDHYASKNKFCSHAVGFCKFVSCSSRSISYHIVMSWSVVSKSDNSVAHWHYNLNLLRLACYCCCCLVNWCTLMVEAFAGTHGVYWSFSKLNIGMRFFTFKHLQHTHSRGHCVDQLVCTVGVVVHLKWLLSCTSSWFVGRLKGSLGPAQHNRVSVSEDRCGGARRK